MSEKEINGYIKNLSDKDKKKRQEACENLEVRGLLLGNDQRDLLRSAVNAVNKTRDDKERSVRRKADSAYRTLNNHLSSLESTSSRWGTSSDESKTPDDNYSYRLFQKL